MSKRTILLLLACMALGALVSGSFSLWRHLQEAPATSTGVGGPFAMTDQDGAPVTEAALKGKPTVMFFGFTYCPDICPTTLTDVTRWMKALGRDADRLNVVFVSVDPERDTPDQLKQYLTSFDPRIRAYTGTPEQVAAMTTAYKAYYQKVPLEGGSYTMDHSSTLFLFDRKGGFVELIPYGAADEVALPRLRQLLK